jgi:ribosomal protein S18 acetylase RimI-like enzyme
VASMLMHVAEVHARSSGARRIRIGVLAANSGAHELYRRLGYHDQEVVLEKELEGIQPV